MAVPVGAVAAVAVAAADVRLTALIATKQRRLHGIGSHLLGSRLGLGLGLGLSFGLLLQRAFPRVSRTQGLPSSRAVRNARRAIDDGPLPLRERGGDVGVHLARHACADAAGHAQAAEHYATRRAGHSDHILRMDLALTLKICLGGGRAAAAVGSVRADAVAVAGRGGSGAFLLGLGDGHAHSLGGVHAVA